MSLTAQQREERLAPDPGIYPGVRLPDYLRWPLPSRGTLLHCADSPSHYKAALEGERTKIATDDMILGSALHTAFLEPEMMPEVVVCWYGTRRAGKLWDAFAEEHADKYILTEGMYEKLVGMVRSLRRHPFTREWLSRIEDVEVSAVGDYKGLRMKGRCDALTSDPLVDLKKVRSTHPRSVVRTVLDFGYHVQAEIYCKLFDRDRMVLLTIEDQPPYDVVPYELSSAFRREGWREAERLALWVQECERTGEWPGRSDEVVEIEPPEWAISDVGVSLE